MNRTDQAHTAPTKRYCRMPELKDDPDFPPRMNNQY
jgi:hypothetical protein